MTEQANRRLLTTSDIAALANVDASTVSNWRRRFDGTFPTPALTDDQGKRPKFDRDEIVEWLRQNPQVGSQRNSTFDKLRVYAPPEVIASIAGRMLVAIEEARRAGRPTAIRRPEEVRQLIEVEAASNRAQGGPGESYSVPDDALVSLYESLEAVDDTFATHEEILLQGQGRLSYAAEHTTPSALAAFICALTDSNSHGLVVDPAAGYGGLLLACIRGGRAASGLGLEINRQVAEVASRRIFLADVDAEILNADSLTQDPLHRPPADLVVADPPLGMSMRIRPEVASPIDWEFGTPKASNADTAWLQVAVSHLKLGGRAIVVTTTGTLFQADKATAQIRNEMVRRGAVQAVFTLPGRLRANTNIRLAVWVLTTPDAPDRRNDVLLVDLGADDTSAIAPDGPGVRAFKSWMSDPAAKLDSTFAVAVPVTDLLAPDATLLPSKWTTIKEDGIDGEAWKRRVDVCTEAANASLGSQQQLPKISVQPRTDIPSRVTVGDLVNQGAVTIIRGRHMERHHGDEESLAILTVKEARSMQPDSAAAEERVASDPASVAQLVQPGDVLVYPDKDSVVARVWNDTGWVIGRFMQVIRVVDNAWDAHYLAAAINNPTNARHLRDGVARTHFTLTEFEIVMLDREAQQVAAQIDRQYEELTAQLAKASEAVALARTETLTALSSGTVVVEVE